MRRLRGLFFGAGGVGWGQLPHCGARAGGGAKDHWLDVGAPRPHAPRQGAQALHRSMELVCRASFGNSECAKIAKNLSPFMAADFSLFCHGFCPRGPSRPPHPLALGWRTAECLLEQGSCWSERQAGWRGCRTAIVPLGAEVWFGAIDRWLDVGAPRPHAPRQGAQALHRSWELVCRASFGNSECAKIAKNLSPFLSADFSLFCHGSARGGPHVPRTPLRWAAALRSASGVGAKDHWLDVGAPRPLKATGHKPSNLTAPFQISAATVFMSSIASPRFPALRSLRASSLAFAYFAINSCSNFAHSAGNSAHNPSFL